MDSKNSADLRPQVDRSADHHITAGRLKSLELDYRHLISKYATISRYHDTECHDISISSLGYDMNPSRVSYCFILSTGTMIQIDFVMRPRSSSRGAKQVR